MRLEIAANGMSRIIRQRNLFLLLTVMLAITSSIMSVRMLTMEERIIMVPPLTSEVVISGKRVSSSYLEQMTMVFLNFLLDLSSSDIRHKRDVILKYTASSDPNFVQKINEYFAESADKYKNFDLVTYFTVKNMEINEEQGEVIAHGTLTSRYGKHGFDTMPMSYRLSFEFSGGYLRLKEFAAVVDEKSRKKEEEKKTKNDTAEVKS